MTPEQATASYRRQIGIHGRAVAIRRYSGSGPARTPVDALTIGYVGTYVASSVIGSIMMIGEQRVIVLADGLAAMLPVTTNDKLVIGKREFAIKNVIRREIAGTLIALELQCAG